MRERTFIEHLIATRGGPDEAVELDVGDDMAVVRVPGGRVLTAIDAVVEGRHFLADTDLFAVGRKAVLRNLSDVAAMAGRPIACLASATLPANFPQARAERLLAGLRDAATRYACPLVGGDTSTHATPEAPLVVSVAVLAEPATPSGRVVTRRGLRLGDRIAVTGTLGGAVDADGGGRHLDFEPRLEAARELVAGLGDDLHAMIDLSDGLGVDARHLVEAAEDRDAIAIEIDAIRVPCTPGLDWSRAITDGEDFELLFAVSAVPPESAGGVPITEIGRAVARDGGPAVRLRADGTVLDVSECGFEHGSRTVRGPRRSPVEAPERPIEREDLP